MVIASNKDNETIVAQCTPSGTGAVALIRISGDKAFDIATSISLLASKKKLNECETHTIHYGWVVECDGTLVDTVLFFLMKAPKTFTGQNTVEISCHNNPFIIERIINRAINAGARMAQGGEFSQRSFLSGKIDLLQAEAINEVIHANHQLLLQQSLSQLNGSLSSWIKNIEEQLFKALALSEASFEFIDEETTFGQQIRDIVCAEIARIEVCKKAFNQQQQIRQGIRISLIGSVNSGKSSLFNALLNQDRAIVADVAGTTRDVIEVGLYVNGNYWTLVDTAGLRQTNDSIEREGIKRSLQEAQKSDIVVVVYDGSRVMTPEEKEIYNRLLIEFNNKSLLVCNKIDLPYITDHDLQSSVIVKTSVQDKTSINNLHYILQQKVLSLFSSIESPFLLNKRHHHLLVNVDFKLKTVIKLLSQEHVAYELISCHLQDALEDLSGLTGKSINEKGMDAVFREFCVGK